MQFYEGVEQDAIEIVLIAGELEFRLSIAALYGDKEMVA